MKNIAMLFVISVRIACFYAEPVVRQACFA